MSLLNLLRKLFVVSFAAGFCGLFGFCSFANAGGCGCGGSGVRATRSAWGGHTFAGRSRAGGASMSGMNMPMRPMCMMNAGGGMTGMNMPMMNAGGGMTGMNMPMTTAAPSAATVNGAKYSCPMHPNVVSAAPGACPICNMALVPKAK